MCELKKEKKKKYIEIWKYKNKKVMNKKKKWINKQSPDRK